MEEWVLEMIREHDDLVSIKVGKIAHLFLRHTPTMGIQMQWYASRCILAGFERDFPELYKRIASSIEAQGLRYVKEHLHSLDDLGL